ncbi:MAG TPA: hypothetical protein VNX46_07035 [Candidatus Acidoferrum sp.]|nr:hypothetical protein [Candidatus Acidoferrum sp.]
MIKFKIIALAAIAMGTLASLLVAGRAQVKFRAQAALLQKQNEQLAALTTEHQRLTGMVARAANAPAMEDHSAELAKLRSEVEALEKQTNEVIRQSVASHQPQPAPMPSPPHPPEYWEKLHQLAGSKSTDARDLGLAFCEYASDHQGQSPENLDQLASYLTKNSLSWSGTNQFEIVYYGSMDDLKGIPSFVIAVVREVQPWTSPDGKMTRVYGMAGGVGQIVSSDDNFQSWEANHVISKNKPGETAH